MSQLPRQELASESDQCYQASVQPRLQNAQNAYGKVITCWARYYVGQMRRASQEAGLAYKRPTAIHLVAFNGCNLTADDGLQRLPTLTARLE